MEVEEEDIQTQQQNQQREPESSRRQREETSSCVMRNWNNPSSRIVRVSRASGGKDRHSKVLTSKGLRDRRIRLSVSTAIQFYDLQDRLGFDQPSKAVEWLINAASESISELPSLNTNFEDQSVQNQTKSSSGTSESSLLSLSRTEIRGKARERARERTAKEKDLQQQQNPSFTQLLTGGFENPNRNWNGSDCFNNPVQLIPNSSSQQDHQTQLSFVQDYNFGISSSQDSPGVATSIDGGYRGTLQSNSLFLNTNFNNVLNSNNHH